MNERIEGVLQGAAAGLMGTVVLQGLRTASGGVLPGSMAPVREDPGEFMIHKAEARLPPRVRGRIPAPMETVAAKSLAVGYGMTAGALYAAFRPGGGDLIVDGSLLGLGTWAAGYLGWLPALGLMPPVSEQESLETIAPPIRHILFGMATVAAYRLLRGR